MAKARRTLSLASLEMYLKVIWAIGFRCTTRRNFKSKKKFAWMFLTFGNFYLFFYVANVCKQTHVIRCISGVMLLQNFFLMSILFSYYKEKLIFSVFEHNKFFFVKSFWDKIDAMPFSETKTLLFSLFFTNCAKVVKKLPLI